MSQEPKCESVLVLRLGKPAGLDRNLSEDVNPAGILEVLAGAAHENKPAHLETERHR